MILQNEKIILRPLKESDISDRILWDTTEIEWQLWDGPWENEGKTAEQRAQEAEELKRTLEARLKEPHRDGLATRLEICVNDAHQTHVGWCSAYTIDDDCCISDIGERYAVGICIPPTAERRKGYAAAALKLYIRYFLDSGISEIYTQTWSGNLRMIGLAEKLGFEEFRRKCGLRTVRGGVYDGLTFCLNLEKFYK